MGTSFSSISTIGFSAGSTFSAFTGTEFISSALSCIVLVLLQDNINKKDRRNNIFLIMIFNF
jgi:hypothetical protein